MKFQEKKFWIERFSRMEILKNVQTHVKDFRRILGVLYKRLRHYFICITTQNDHVSKTVQFQCLKATSEHLQIEKIHFLEISRVDFFSSSTKVLFVIALAKNVACMLSSQNFNKSSFGGGIQTMYCISRSYRDSSCTYTVQQS